MATPGGIKVKVFFILKFHARLMFLGGPISPPFLDRLVIFLLKSVQIRIFKKPPDKKNIDKILTQEKPIFPNFLDEVLYSNMLWKNRGANWPPAVTKRVKLD